MEKIKTRSKIFANDETPIEFEEVISDDFDIAYTFNKFFVNIVSNLEISPEETFETNVDDINDQF